MKLALADISTNKGISLRDVVKKYNVPKSTLNDKARGARPSARRMGPKTLLSSEMENKIVKCLFTLADAGFPITKQQLIDNVTNLMSQRADSPFKNGRPGETWFQLFCARHPTITMRVAQNISRVRAGVTEANLRKWFEDTRKICENNNCTEALFDPKRVYNLDGTAFFLSLKLAR